MEQNLDQHDIEPNQLGLLNQEIEELDRLIDYQHQKVEKLKTLRMLKYGSKTHAPEANSKISDNIRTYKNEALPNSNKVENSLFSRQFFRKSSISVYDVVSAKFVRFRSRSPNIGSLSTELTDKTTAIGSFVIVGYRDSRIVAYDLKDFSELGAVTLSSGIPSKLQTDGSDLNGILLSVTSSSGQLHIYMMSVQSSGIIVNGPRLSSQSSIIHFDFKWTSTAYNKAITSDYYIDSYPVRPFSSSPRIITAITKQGRIDSYRMNSTLSYSHHLNQSHSGQEEEEEEEEMMIGTGKSIANILSVATSRRIFVISVSGGRNNREVVCQLPGDLSCAYHVFDAHFPSVIYAASVDGDYAVFDSRSSSSCQIIARYKDVDGSNLIQLSTKKGYLFSSYASHLTIFNTTNVRLTNSLSVLTSTSTSTSMRFMTDFDPSLHSLDSVHFLSYPHSNVIDHCAVNGSDDLSTSEEEEEVVLYQYIGLGFHDDSMFFTDLSYARIPMILLGILFIILYQIYCRKQKPRKSKFDVTSRSDLLKAAQRLPQFKPTSLTTIASDDEDNDD